MTDKTLRIEVRLGEPYWREIGRKSLEFELAPGASVANLLEAVERRYPELLRGDLPPTVFLDDELADPGTPLAKGARVSLLWAAAGG